jgi:DNA-binding transcriptional LysR family regulator
MAHQLSLRQLRTFLAVVEAGGISAAARTLHLTQPAASQQLRELERALHARLLERAGGKVLPTTAGEALLGPARRIQAAVEDAFTAVASLRTGDTGRVRLGTGATACIYLLPPVLAAVKRRMPALEVIIATGNSNDMLRRVAEGELDIALVTMPIAAQRGLSVTRLMSDPLVALVPETIADPGASLTATQIARLPLILYERGGSTRAIIDAWFRRAGLTPSPIMQLDSIESIKTLVGGGLGASIMPRLALARPVKGAVVRALRPALSRQLAVVLRKGKVVDRGLRVLMHELSERGS